MSERWPWPKVIGVSVGLPVATYVGLDVATGGKVTQLVTAPIKCLKSVDINNTKCLTAPLKFIPPASGSGSGSGDIISTADKVKDFINDAPEKLGLLYHGLVNTLTNVVNIVPGVELAPHQIEAALPYIGIAAIGLLAVAAIRQGQIAANRYR